MMNIKKLHLAVWAIVIVSLWNLTSCTSGIEDYKETKSDTILTKETEEAVTAENTDSTIPKAPDESEAQAITEVVVDYAEIFDGIHGCAVVYDPEENTYGIYNKALCETQVSPYSTFKIVSTLIGLKNNVLKDEVSTMNYSGVDYPVADWNKNLSLKDAFKTSCVWYFRQVMDAVGPDVVKKELEILEYGNGDVSEWEGSGINPLPDLNGFWQASSLKISPMEQVRVLARIFEGGSGYDIGDLKILKNIMLVDDGDNHNIYGKTGSGSPGQAWFTGFFENGGKRKYFAVYLEDAANADIVSGSRAREIAMKIITGIGE